MCAKSVNCSPCRWTVALLLICAAGVHSVEFYTEKPPFMESCKIYQPGFTKCSTRSVQRMMEEVVKGSVPEVIEEFGPLDPLKVETIIFEQDNNAGASINANLTDLLVRGFSKMRIKESKVSKKDFSWETKIFLPKMRMDGKYKMKGQILIIPLNGAGRMFIEIDNLDILMHTKTRLYEKGGFTFYNVTKIRVDLKMTGVKTNFDNIFNGNSPDIEKSTNQFFNENWRDFFEALRPIVNKTVEKILLGLLGKIFHVIPANFLVEDIPTSEQLYGKRN